MLKSYTVVRNGATLYEKNLELFFCQTWRRLEKQCSHCSVKTV